MIQFSLLESRPYDIAGRGAGRSRLCPGTVGGKRRAISKGSHIKVVKQGHALSIIITEIQ